MNCHTPPTGPSQHAAVLPALALTGFGTASGPSSGNDRTATTQPTTTARNISWTTVGTTVEAATVSADGRVLTVQARVPGGVSALFVNVLAESRAADGTPQCTAYELATVAVDLPTPLPDGRIVVVNHFDKFVVSAATAPALSHCGTAGCHPVPTGCTEASYAQAEIDADTPAHSISHPRDDWEEWKDILEAAGVRDLRVHDERHTTGTLLVESGVPVRVVMEILGQSSLRMTQRYPHVASPVAAAAASALGVTLWGDDEPVTGSRTETTTETRCPEGRSRGRVQHARETANAQVRWI